MRTPQTCKNNVVFRAPGLPALGSAIWIGGLGVFLWLGFGTANVFAQPASLRLHAIHFSIKGGRRTVLFRFSYPPASIRSFALASPPRLVIDVNGPVESLPSGIYQAEDTLLAQVRTGSHPHRLRLVLDLKGRTAPPYSVDQQEALVIAIFGEPIGVQGGGSAQARTQVLFSLAKKTADARRLPLIPAPAPPPVSPETVLKKESAAQSLPQEARYHLEQGQILYDAGKVDEAIVQWQKTARLAPNAAKAYHLLGVAFRKRGEHAQAITAFQQALRLEPDNATAQVQLARAFEATGDTQAALAAYHQALQLVPSAPYVHNRLGHLAAAKGDWQTAVNEWQQTIHLAPDYAYAHAHLGEAFEKIGQKREALAAYERAIPVCPRFAQALEKIGKKQEAVTLCAQVRQRVERLRASGS